MTYLGEEAERDYQRQKGRYEAELRRIAKQEKQPADTVFDLRMARQLVSGEFWLEDVEVAEQMTVTNERNRRAMYFAGEGTGDALLMEDFEKQAQLIIN